MAECRGFPRLSASARRPRVPAPEKPSARTPKVSVSTAAPAAPASRPSTMRHFEYVEGTSSKFWEISVSGCEVTVRYGRIGAAGTSKTKEHTDAQAARREADKLIAEKTGKGYVETQS